MILGTAGHRTRSICPLLITCQCRYILGLRATDHAALVVARMGFRWPLVLPSRMGAALRHLLDRCRKGASSRHLCPDRGRRVVPSP
jgi:hypothetical protein